MIMVKSMPLNDPVERPGRYVHGDNPDYDRWTEYIARLLYESETASKLINSVYFPDV